MKIEGSNWTFKLNGLADSFDKSPKTEGNLENSEGLDFSKLLFEQLHKVSQLEEKSNQLQKDFVVGKTDNIAQVIMAGEKAKLALEFTVEMRNKIINSYKEIMRMPI